MEDLLNTARENVAKAVAHCGLRIEGNALADADPRIVAQTKINSIDNASRKPSRAQMAERQAWAEWLAENA